LYTTKQNSAVDVQRRAKPWQLARFALALIQFRHQVQLTLSTEEAAQCYWAATDPDQHSLQFDATTI